MLLKKDYKRSNILLEISPFTEQGPPENRLERTVCCQKRLLAKTILLKINYITRDEPLLSGMSPGPPGFLLWAAHGGARRGMVNVDQKMSIIDYKTKPIITQAGFNGKQKSFGEKM